MTEQWSEDVPHYYMDSEGKMFEQTPWGLSPMPEAKDMPRPRGESLDAIVGLYKDVRGVFDGDANCEVPDHYTSESHGGAGEWYVVGKCPDCGDVQTTLMCGTFVSHMEANPTLRATCDCGSYPRVGDIIVMKQRKN